MKKRFLILTVLLVATVATVWVMVGKGSREPRIDGRLLSEWITDIALKRNVQRARVALVDSGTNEVPLLVQWAVETTPAKPSLQSRLTDQYNTEIRRLRGRGMTNLHFMKRGMELDHQWLAEVALPELAPEGRTAAVTQLMPRLASTNEDISGSACFMLSKLAPEAIDPLIALMKTGDDDNREIAATAIGMMGTNGAPAIPALRKMISEPSLSVKMLAATTLAELGADPITFVPTMLQAFAEIKDPNTLYANLNEAMQQYARAGVPKPSPPSAGLSNLNISFSTTNATNAARH